MTPFTRLAVLALVACAHAQYQEDRAPRYIASEPKAQASTPVPILKQINRHNEDGSYTYGYEAADGSFKIETKSPAGEVKGKYGYKDDTGKVRVIEYGANKYGFQPSGEGITVAPPTLVDETNREESRPGKQSQGSRNQYRPAPAQAIDYDYNDEPAPPPRPSHRPAQQYRPQPAPQQPQYRPAAPQPQYRAPAQSQFRAPAPGQFSPPAPTQAPRYTAVPPNPEFRPQSSGPVPPKPAFFSGASPSVVEDNFFNPEPAPQRRQYQKQQEHRPPSQFQDFNSNPRQFAQGPSQAEQPSFSAPRPQHAPYSMLDQLLKEYALPANGSPALHDITFGSY